MQLPSSHRNVKDPLTRGRYLLIQIVNLDAIGSGKLRFSEQQPTVGLRRYRAIVKGDVQRSPTL